MEISKQDDKARKQPHYSVNRKIKRQDSIETIEIEYSIDQKNLVGTQLKIIQIYEGLES